MASSFRYATGFLVLIQAVTSLAYVTARYNNATTTSTTSPAITSSACPTCLVGAAAAYGGLGIVAWNSDIITLTLDTVSPYVVKYNNTQITMTTTIYGNLSTISPSDIPELATMVSLANEDSQYYNQVPIDFIKGTVSAYTSGSYITTLVYPNGYAYYNVIAYEDGQDGKCADTSAFYLALEGQVASTSIPSVSLQQSIFASIGSMGVEEAALFGSAGHICPDGMFAEPEAMAALYSALGINPSGCQSQLCSGQPSYKVPVSVLTSTLAGTPTLTVTSGGMYTAPTSSASPQSSATPPTVSPSSTSSTTSTSTTSSSTESSSSSSVPTQSSTSEVSSSSSPATSSQATSTSTISTSGTTTTTSETSPSPSPTSSSESSSISSTISPSGSSEVTSGTSPSSSSSSESPSISSASSPSGSSEVTSGTSPSPSLTSNEATVTLSTTVVSGSTEIISVTPPSSPSAAASSETSPVVSTVVLSGTTEVISVTPSSEVSPSSGTTSTPAILATSSVTAIIISGTTYTGNPSGGFSLPGGTVYPGTSTAISGVSYYLSGTELVSGTATISVAATTATVQVSAPGVFQVGTQTASAGGAPITVSGTTYSLVPSATAVVIAASGTTTTSSIPISVSTIATSTFGSSSSESTSSVVATTSAAVGNYTSSTTSATPSIATYTGEGARNPFKPAANGLILAFAALIILI